MIRHEFLAGLHTSYAPRTYLQIGVNDGRDLAQSRTRTIGVDPGFAITAELACDLRLAKATGEEFFARPDSIAWFPDGIIDLAFVNGLHVFESALRDFINIERLAGPASVVVFDGALPRSAAQGARDRRTSTWAGDVYKLALAFAKHRPDLVVVPIDTEPTGMLLVVGLDPTNTTLSDRYDEILVEYAVADPQVVPHEVTHRTAAADPATLLASPVWGELIAAGDVSTAIATLAELRGTASFLWSEPDDALWPPALRTGPKKSAAKKTAAKKATAKTAAAKKVAAKQPPPPRTVAGSIHRIRKAIKRRL
jgi:hypothetical protein